MQKLPGRVPSAGGPSRLDYAMVIALIAVTIIASVVVFRRGLL